MCAAYTEKYAMVEIHSEFEARFIDLGLSDKGRLLTVVYTERGLNIRIISCRKASNSERKFYEKEGRTR